MMRDSISASSIQIQPGLMNKIIISRANGNVYVVSDSGYTLTTNEILWDNRYKMIVAEDSVMFTTTKGDTLYGVGFESDMDLEQWRIFQNIWRYHGREFKLNP